MKQIWKFPVTDLAKGPLSVAGLGKIVLFGADPSGDLCLWVEVDPDASEVVRRLFVVGTGHNVKGDMEHVASCVDGMFVWHLYEVKQ